MHYDTNRHVCSNDVLFWRVFFGTVMQNCAKLSFAQNFVGIFFKIINSLKMGSTVNV